MKHENLPRFSEKHKNHPRFSEALTFASDHFLSRTNNLSGDEIYAALTGTDEEFKQSGIRLWASLNEDRKAVAGLIHLLAEYFINFLDKE